MNFMSSNQNCMLPKVVGPWFDTTPIPRVTLPTKFDWPEKDGDVFVSRTSKAANKAMSQRSAYLGDI
jgi:hypothetical protein